VTRGRRSGRGVSRLIEQLGFPEDDRSRFLEGIILGAFVGAAIGGSTLWNRVRQRSATRAAVADEIAPAEPGPAAERRD
jgi:hypothetical protein